MKVQLPKGFKASYMGKTIGAGYKGNTRRLIERSSINSKYMVISKEFNRALQVFPSFKRAYTEMVYEEVKALIPSFMSKWVSNIFVESRVWSDQSETDWEAEDGLYGTDTKHHASRPTAVVPSEAGAPEDFWDWARRSSSSLSMVDQRGMKGTQSAEEMLEDEPIFGTHSDTELQEVSHSGALKPLNTMLTGMEDSNGVEDASENEGEVPEENDSEEDQNDREQEDNEVSIAQTLASSAKGDENYVPSDEDSKENEEEEGGVTHHHRHHGRKHKKGRKFHKKRLHEDSDEEGDSEEEVHLHGRHRHHRRHHLKHGHKGHHGQKSHKGHHGHKTHHKKSQSGASTSFLAIRSEENATALIGEGQPGFDQYQSQEKHAQKDLDWQVDRGIYEGDQGSEWVNPMTGQRQEFDPKLHSETLQRGNLANGGTRSDVKPPPPERKKRVHAGWARGYSRRPQDNPQFPRLPTLLFSYITLPNDVVSWYLSQALTAGLGTKNERPAVVLQRAIAYNAYASSATVKKLEKILANGIVLSAINQDQIGALELGVQYQFAFLISRIKQEGVAVELRKWDRGPRIVESRESDPGYYPGQFAGDPVKAEAAGDGEDFDKNSMNTGGKVEVNQHPDRRTFYREDSAGRFRGQFPN